MSQSLSRRSFLKCAGSGAVSLAAALLTGVSAAALAPCYQGEPALLDGKAAVELLGYAPAPGLGGALVHPQQQRHAQQQKGPAADAPRREDTGGEAHRQRQQPRRHRRYLTPPYSRKQAKMRRSHRLDTF